MTLASRPVLVLNRSWSPVGIIRLEKAIGLLFGIYSPSVEYPKGQPKAVVVDTDSYITYTWEDWSRLKPKEGEDSIAGVRRLFRVPEVVVLTRYDKLPNRKVTFSRRTLYKRDNFTCQYCGKTPGSEELTLDHVIPRSKGGETTWENCVIACVKCNTKKADKTLGEAHMRLLRKPFKPKYSFLQGAVPCRSWTKFISEVYWLSEMQNDNKE